MDFKAIVSKHSHLRDWKPNNMASLSRSICFLQWSDCLAAFFCIADNSEALSDTVIKDEFSSPVEKTPQFSYDRLYFIMRWKDITAGEKEKIRGLCYSQRLSNIISFSVEAHCARNTSVGFQNFLGLSAFSEQTIVEKWWGSGRSQTFTDWLGRFPLEQSRCSQIALLTAHSEESQLKSRPS